MTITHTAMGPGQRNLFAPVTYWPVITGKPGDYNTPVFDDPILIHGQLDTISQMVRNREGDEIMSTGTFYLDTDVNERGWLALGDQTQESDPRTLLDDNGRHVAFEIHAFESCPDLRQATQQRKAHLR